MGGVFNNKTPFTAMVGQWKVYYFRSKAPEASNGDLTCYVLSFEDAVAHISVTDPSGILTIER